MDSRGCSLRETLLRLVRAPFKLGAGILGIPYAMMNLGGFLMGVVVIALFAGASVYGGLVLGWLHGSDRSITTYGLLA